MKICIVLPGYTRQPIGGFRIIYQYANQLCKRGNNVYLYCLNECIMEKYSIPKFAKRVFANILTQKEPSWFPLDKKIIKLSHTCVKDRKNIKDIDIVIATSVDSVESTVKIFNYVPKVYFIQGFENWCKGDEYCYKTYNMGLKNVVVSSWLEEIVKNHSTSKPILLRNPIDLNQYCVINPVEKRDIHTIGLLYHTMPTKGVEYALKVIWRIKELYPDLIVYMFGVPKRPDEFPEWIRYTQCATIEQTTLIYNKVNVWLCASIDEGFGLTGLEAMACGAALVSTSYAGVLEYAENGYNALLSPVKDVTALEKNVIELFENNKKRIELVQNGLKSVTALSIDNAVKQLELLLIELLEKE